MNPGEAKRPGKDGYCWGCRDGVATSGLDETMNESGVVRENLYADGSRRTRNNERAGYIRRIAGANA